MLRTIHQSLLCSAALGAATMLVTACSGGALTPTPSGAGALLPSAIARGAVPSGGISPAKTRQFVTLDDQNDPTFNQLLGINNAGEISGYFGSGASGHPNKGYTLAPPYGQGNYSNENYPGSAQTQVTALNNKGDTAGFWVDNSNVNRGFIEWKGVFTTYTDPKTGGGSVNQILGLNDKGIAVGFYVDGSGVSHGFTLNQATGKFKAVVPPGATNVVASGINDDGDVTGFVTSASGQSSGFLEKNGSFSSFSFPSGYNTQPFGVNSRDQIAGSYLDGSGVQHGFLLSHPLSHAKWQSLDDPNGIGSTVVNGLNDNGEMVGFYTDAAGNTDGMLIQP
ncbi:MAG: hypothetical protein WA814_12885 [Candidatus Baltobacteraceae bacterium]